MSRTLQTLQANVTVGLDLGDRTSRVYEIDDAGQCCAEQTIATTPGGVERYFATRPRCRVVLEVGTHSPWGRADIRLLHPIQHRTAVAQQHLELIRARDQVVQVRTKLINHVRGVVKSTGPGCRAVPPRRSRGAPRSSSPRRCNRRSCRSWRC